MNIVGDPSHIPDEDVAADPDVAPSTENLGTDVLDPEVSAAPEEAFDDIADAGAATPTDAADALRAMEARLNDQRNELDEYRRLFDELRADAEHRLRQADEEAFLEEVRRSYEKDPVAAFRMMLDRSQHELWRAVQGELKTQLKADADRRSAMAELLDRPENAVVKPYLDEMRYLVSERGFDPQEAAAFLKTVADKALASLRIRAHAVQRVRRRAAVESGGSPTRPSDPDREFYRIIKKAKTLDDMFEGLRKAGRRAAH
ncbi:MAG: hypothetical protein ACP5M0_14335 [Desulfomonilaceae bacterium]